MVVEFLHFAWGHLFLQSTYVWEHKLDFFVETTSKSQDCAQEIQRHQEVINLILVSKPILHSEHPFFHQTTQYGCPIHKLMSYHIAQYTDWYSLVTKLIDLLLTIHAWLASFYDRRPSHHWKTTRSNLNFNFLLLQLLIPTVLLLLALSLVYSNFS